MCTNGSFASSSLLSLPCSLSLIFSVMSPFDENLYFCALGTDYLPVSSAHEFLTLSPNASAPALPFKTESRMVSQFEQLFGSADEFLNEHLSFAKTNTAGNGTICTAPLF